jgi:hypothetical protein
MQGKTTTKHERYWDTSAVLSSEKARLHALQLYVMRSIAHSHGGTIETDLANQTINVTVPGIQGDACAQEIEEQVSAMAHYLYAQVDALFSGEILVRVNLN